MVERVEGAGDGLTVFVDNYDSFTYNIVQYFQQLGADVRVFRNDEVTVADIEALRPARLVISPGPGAPHEAGISMETIRHFAGRIPILGVCLGHQAMVEVFGGKVTGAGEIMHGKVSPIHHDGTGVFAGLPSPLLACRYHSLAAEPSSMPECLVVTARSRRADAAAPPATGAAAEAASASNDGGTTGLHYNTLVEVDPATGVIQGARHATLSVEGVQFHPESIATQGGHRMFATFLRRTAGTWAADPVASEEFAISSSSSTTTS